MAKRKRSTKDSTPARKRSKATLGDSDGSPSKASAAHPHGEFDASQEYKVRAIIDERRTHYLIQWEDDEVTGERYDDTWEPKDYVNRLAVEEWQATKKQRSAAARGVAKKKSTTPRPRGKPRKSVVESSPPPTAQSPGTSGFLPEAEQPQTEDLEIGESQPTVAGAQGDSQGGSPLFVSADSPPPHKARVTEQPSVQISDPPSSYAAGLYQNFSSSQIPESAEPRRRTSISVGPTSSELSEESAQPQQREVSLEVSSQRSPGVTAEALPNKSPEASQWQPEEGDTSKTTNSATEASVAPPCSNEPSQLVLENSQRPANGAVPQSSSLPDSSSFAPSATQARTQSPYTSEPRGRGRPPKEVTQVPIAPQSQDVQSSWHGLSSPVAIQSSQLPTQESVEPSSSQAPQVNVSSQHEQASQGLEEAQSRQPSPPNSAGIEEHSQAAASQAPRFASQAGSRPSSEQSLDLPPIVASQASPHPDQPSSHAESAPPRSGVTRLPGSASLPSIQNISPDPQTQAIATPQLQRQATASGATPNNQPSEREELTQEPEADIRDTTERPDLSAIDLTADTQPPPAQTSSIAVTPPPLRHEIAAQRNAQSNLTAHSWQSPSLGLQTQISRHFSSTAGGRQVQSQGASTQGPLPSQSQPKFNPSLGQAFEPSGPSSQIRSSSPIGPGPQRSLSTFPFIEGVPSRPTTPSSPLRPSSQSPGMEGSQPSRTSAKEKLRALREKHRSKRQNDGHLDRSVTPTSVPLPPAVETSPPKFSIPPHVTADAPLPNPARLASPLLRAQDGARSPSVVPAMEALPEITMEEMNTSERYPTLLPQASVAEDSESQRNGSLTGRVTPLQQPVREENPETASAHSIPIVLMGHQRDQYPQMVYYHQDLIQQILKTRDPEDLLIAKANTFVQRMHSIAVHPDLDNAETFTQYDVEPQQQASWDVSCSAKFRFLAQLLDALRGEDIHIVIALQHSRLTDILRTFLRGINVSFVMADRPSVPRHAGSGALQVTIFNENGEGTDIAKPDLVVALDNSFHHEDSVIRSLRRLGETWCPFASLVVPHSVEHIERQLSSDLNDRARLRALVSGINQFKGEAGRAEKGQLNPTESANALAAYLKDESQSKSWPLVGLRALDNLDSQTESEIEPLESMASPAGGAKRQRAGSDEVHEDDLNKRVRIEPFASDAAVIMPTTVNPLDVELTHISDSVEKLTQPSGEGGPEDSARTDIEKQLQRLLQEALDRNEELTSALSDLQYRHEDARTDLMRIASERDQAAATALSLDTRVMDGANRESALRTERSELKKQLEEANVRLLTHPNPERAEMESLRQALALANNEKAVMTKRLEQARKDSDFFRSQYQDASTAAQREVVANAELRDQLETVTRRATGEQAKLRAMSYDARSKQLEDENKKLKAVLKDRELGLRFRDEEIAKLKEVSRGRMGTRGTSVPRSPRLASPMGAGRSRPGSPAVGEIAKGKGSLLHPLRNNA